VLADQAVFTPIHLAIFLSTMAYLGGASPRARLRSAYWEALKKNWLVWPAVQAANFSVVPLHHRVLVVNVASIGWNCYLSWINNRAGRETVTR
jgi:protein Mpv17